VVRLKGSNSIGEGDAFDDFPSGVLLVVQAKDLGCPRDRWHRDGHRLGKGSTVGRKRIRLTGICRQFRNDAFRTLRGNLYGLGLRYAAGSNLYASTAFGGNRSTELRRDFPRSRLVIR
jgi:hypothetical protein